MDLYNKFKFHFFKASSPSLIKTRDLLIKAGLIRHTGRQPYTLGWIAPETSVEDFIKLALRKGFDHNSLAWRDDGELYSLRLIKNFKHQYHLRVFEDGEIRGHFERTPEVNPIRHFFDIGMEPRREDFISWFGDAIVADEAFVSNSKNDTPERFTHFA
jgi:hypothetical protein